MGSSNKKLKLNGGNNEGTRKNLDDYPTPPDVTIALMEFLQLDKKTIWEPACGNGTMSGVLKNYGHNVIETDILTGYDFLSCNYKCDAIITNPPFYLSTEFIKKATKNANLVAFVLKSQFWHAKKRLELFNQNPPSYVLPLTWRPDFLYQEKGKKGSPTMEVAWSVWIKGYNNTIYKPLAKPKLDK